MHSGPRSMLLTPVYTACEQLTAQEDKPSPPRQLCEQKSQVRQFPDTPTTLITLMFICPPPAGSGGQCRACSQLTTREKRASHPTGPPWPGPSMFGRDMALPGQSPALSLSSPGTWRALSSLCPDVSSIKWADSPRFGRNRGVQIPVALRTVAGALRI